MTTAQIDQANVEQAGKVLGRAFWDDPAAIYVMPDDEKRAEQLAWFMTCAARYGEQFGTVHTPREALEAAAIWLPPEETHVSDEKMSEAGFDELPDRLGEDGYERFGNDPPRQGQGVGSTLIQQGLKAADADGLPCYLETMKARNVPFYQRHGFEVVVDEIVPNGGPRLWTMKRPPAR